MTHTNAYAGNTYRLPKTAEEAAEICSSGVYEPGVAIGVVALVIGMVVYCLAVRKRKRLKVSGTKQVKAEV